MLGKIIVDFSVPRDRLGYLGLRILVPVVVSAVSDEYAAQAFYFLDQVFSFHETFKSSSFRTQGIEPLVKSL